MVIHDSVVEEAVGETAKGSSTEKSLDNSDVERSTRPDQRSATLSKMNGVSDPFAFDSGRSPKTKQRGKTVKGQVVEPIEVQIAKKARRPSADAKVVVVDSIGNLSNESGIQELNEDNAQELHSDESAARDTTAAPNISASAGEAELSESLNEHRSRLSSEASSGIDDLGSIDDIELASVKGKTENERDSTELTPKERKRQTRQLFTSRLTDIDSRDLDKIKEGAHRTIETSIPRGLPVRRGSAEANSSASEVAKSMTRRVSGGSLGSPERSKPPPPRSGAFKRVAFSDAPPGPAGVSQSVTSSQPRPVRRRGSFDSPAPGPRAPPSRRPRGLPPRPKPGSGRKNDPFANAPVRKPTRRTNKPPQPSPARGQHDLGLATLKGMYADGLASIQQSKGLVAADVFKTLDVKGIGGMNKDAFYVGGRITGITMTREQSDRLFEALDSSGTGSIDTETFAALSEA